MLASAHTHDGDCHQPRLVLDRIRHNEHPDDQRQEHRRLEVFRNEPAREGPGYEAGGGIADSAREKRGDDHRRNHFEQGRVGCGGREAEVFIGDYGAERAERIVDDRFPLERGGGARLDLRLAQQRQDDRGSRHHENAAKENGNRPDEPGDEVSGETGEQPADRHAEQH